MIKNYFYIMKLTANKTSLNRIFQQIYSQKFKIDGKILEFGTIKNSSKSFTNFLNISDKSSIVFADKRDLKTGIVEVQNLESKLTFEDSIFENVVVFNVLEHVYDIDNAIREIYRCLRTKGTLIGSTPFIHRVHYAPEDYNRYTPQHINKLLKKNNFSNIVVEVFGYGPFTAAYVMIFDYTKLIPLLNNLILTCCIFLDKFIGLFTKTNLKELYPISICFSAKRN